MGGEKEEERNDDCQVSDLVIIDGNTEPQRKSKALGVWARRGGKGDFLLRSLQYLWVRHASGNVQERAKWY